MNRLDGRIFSDRFSLEQHQRERLAALFAEVLPGNRFYAAKLGAPALVAGETPLNTLRRLPFTTKPELVADQQAHPPFGSNLSYPLERYTRFSQTSGTSGAPIRWVDDERSWSWMVDNWVEVFEESGATAADRVFFAFSFGPFLGFWTAFEAARRLGCLCLPGGGMSSPARLRAILDNGVTTLCCTPTYAIRLGEVALEQGIDLASGQVRTIIVAGEPGAGVPATRARIECLWPGARLRDHHGMTEVGPVTFECRARAGVLHVMESAFIAEVIDPETAAPVLPGGRGELVLTNLGRWGAPLIRYRTGDIVQTASEAVCACGRCDLALEGGIVGRTDDMVVVRGVNLFPTAVEELLRGFREIAEYRVEIDSGAAMSELRVRLEPSPACADPEALAREVGIALHAAFNLRAPVQLAAPGELPRFEMKAQRWVRVGADR